MDFRKSRNLIWIGFAVGILIMIFGMNFENEKLIWAFMIVGAVLVFTALIQAFVFYRCPHCGNSLMDVRGEIPEYCHNCGKSLREEYR